MCVMLVLNNDAQFSKDTQWSS